MGDGNGWWDGSENLKKSPKSHRLGCHETKCRQVPECLKRGELRETDASHLQRENTGKLRLFNFAESAMGHTRLGPIPKTRKWNELVEQIAGPSLTGSVPTAVANISAIAAQTLDATQKGLDKAASDPGVRYAFYLLTQVALASRLPNWERALGKHGIRVSNASTVFDFTAEVQDAIDRYISKSTPGATDLSEIAQQAAGESITSLAEPRTASLFSGNTADVQKAIRSLSTQKGFGELGQRFFGRFVARFLNFYLSRVTAGSIGSPRLHDLGAIAEFNDGLRSHCDQSARIVRDFCGEWYSKTEHQKGIDLKNTSRFLTVALRKLRSELKQQRADL